MGKRRDEDIGTRLITMSDPAKQLSVLRNTSTTTCTKYHNFRSLQEMMTSNFMLRDDHVGCRK